MRPKFTSRCSARSSEIARERQVTSVAWEPAGNNYDVITRGTVYLELFVQALDQCEIDDVAMAGKS